jgi:hypothetical protein
MATIQDILLSPIFPLPLKCNQKHKIERKSYLISPFSELVSQSNEFSILQVQNKNGIDQKYLLRLSKRFGFDIHQPGRISLLRNFFLFLHPNGIPCLMSGLVESKRKIIRLSFSELINVMKKDEEIDPEQYSFEKYQSFCQSMQQKSHEKRS